MGSWRIREDSPLSTHASMDDVSLSHKQTLRKHTDLRPYDGGPVPYRVLCGNPLTLQIFSARTMVVLFTAP